MSSGNALATPSTGGERPGAARPSAISGRYANGFWAHHWYCRSWPIGERLSGPSFGSGRSGRRARSTQTGPAGTPRTRMLEWSAGPFVLTCPAGGSPPLGGSSPGPPLQPERRRQLPEQRRRSRVAGFPSGIARRFGRCGTASAETRGRSTVASAILVGCCSRRLWTGTLRRGASGCEATAPRRRPGRPATRRPGTKAMPRRTRRRRRLRSPVMCLERCRPPTGGLSRPLSRLLGRLLQSS